MSVHTAFSVVLSLLLFSSICKVLCDYIGLAWIIQNDLPIFRSADQETWFSLQPLILLCLQLNILRFWKSGCGHLWGATVVSSTEGIGEAGETDVHQVPSVSSAWFQGFSYIRTLSQIIQQRF